MNGWTAGWMDNVVLWFYLLVLLFVFTFFIILFLDINSPTFEKAESANSIKS